MLFPQINSIDESEDAIILSLHVPADLYYFQGHFSHAPILAGVIQVHWAMHYIEKHFNLSVENHLTIDALKFQVIIAPGYNVDLTIKKITNTKVSFNYSSAHGAHTSGRATYQ